jgi:hypothetical protein
LHGRIIQRKPFLRNIYVDFYRQFAEAVGDSAGKLLVEIGSGGGFIKEVIPGAVTSDILELPNIDKVFSAADMPFADESVDAKAGWNLKEAGPVSESNGALPWIVFVRDREVFEREFADLKIVRIRNHTPLRYLLSGGLTLRQLVPSFSYRLVTAVERLLSPLSGWLGMFQTIELEKRP